MIEKKDIYRGMIIKDYMKERYKIHNDIIIDCFFCKNEYKLNVIKQHLRDCKRCINIRNELKNMNNNKFFDDYIIFNNEINKIKKNCLENYYLNKY